MNSSPARTLLVPPKQRFVGGPWNAFPVPPSSTQVWQPGAHLWVVRIHDDPYDFKPVFVETFEAPYFNAPAVTLGYYAYSDRGWIWLEPLSGEPPIVRLQNHGHTVLVSPKNL